MGVEYVRIAAVIVNGQIVRVVLENVACRSSVRAAGQTGHMAAVKGFPSPGMFVCCAIGFVCPGGAVLQPDIQGACEGLAARRNACVSEGVVGNALPGTVIRRQPEINDRCRIRFIGIDGPCFGCNIARQADLVGAGTGDRAAGILFDVHVDGAAL